MEIPECIICNIALEPGKILIGRVEQTKGKSVQRFCCPVCDYSTTLFKGFDFNPFNTATLSIERIFAQEESARAVIFRSVRPKTKIYQPEF